MSGFTFVSILILIMFSDMGPCTGGPYYWHLEGKHCLHLHGRSELAEDIYSETMAEKSSENLEMQPILTQSNISKQKHKKYSNYNLNSRISLQTKVFFITRNCGYC